MKNFLITHKIKKKTVNYGLEIVSHSTSLLWGNLPSKHKLPSSLDEFKRKMKDS